MKGTFTASPSRNFGRSFLRPAGSSTTRRRSGTSQRAVAAEVLQEAGLAAKDVAAIGITNQRETTVIWDRRTGQPIHNAIVWQDRRTRSSAIDSSRGPRSTPSSRRPGW